MASAKLGIFCTSSVGRGLRAAAGLLAGFSGDLPDQLIGIAISELNLLLHELDGTDVDKEAFLFGSRNMGLSIIDSDFRIVDKGIGKVIVVLDLICQLWHMSLGGEAN